MRLVEHVLGSRLDEPLCSRLHELEHRDRIDHLEVRSAEIQRRRFRGRTARGDERCRLAHDFQPRSLTCTIDQELHNSSGVAFTTLIRSILGPPTRNATRVASYRGVIPR